MIAKYLENTHATSHNQYHMELLDVFALEHEKKTFTDVGNRYVFHSFRASLAIYHLISNACSWNNC